MHSDGVGHLAAKSQTCTAQLREDMDVDTAQSETGDDRIDRAATLITYDFVHIRPPSSCHDGLLFPI